ncbi:hypothetical protein [Protofrankia symbiont of Coriaria ruscifolia]|uniref:hypothetical protein n=1 Tax=Protofrankia symbiont of Coriaria ruscifolia TaxID=1306542 RepID=UPI00104136C0|nr:hypothetical protein [Protofrankia symbiont of Coriaria ruscifolia]
MHRSFGPGKRRLRPHVRGLTAITLLLTLALVGCNQHNQGHRRSGSSQAPPPTATRTPVKTPTATRTVTPSTSTSYTDAMFYLGRSIGDPNNRVSCASGIDYPFKIQDATKPIHWKTRFSSGATEVFTDPREGNLRPGGVQVITVRGTYVGASGSYFTVTVYSEQARSVSYSIELFCR